MKVSVISRKKNIWGKDWKNIADATLMLGTFFTGYMAVKKTYGMRQLAKGAIYCLSGEISSRERLAV